MVRHVTFFNFNNKMTRREVFFLSVDNFSISQNAPDCQYTLLSAGRPYQWTPYEGSDIILPKDPAFSTGGRPIFKFK
jgi:hypothetical protein